MKTPNILASFANSKFMTNHITKSINNPKALTRTLLLTSVSKDVFAYALRVKNTLENDKIPEDKKHFSASMDAATGVTTAVVQIGTGFLMSNDKLQNSIANKLFKPIADNKTAFKHAKASFSAISTMVVATLFAKRILTPLIASKIIDKREAKIHAKEAQAPIKDPTTEQQNIALNQGVRKITPYKFIHKKPHQTK